MEEPDSKSNQEQAHNAANSGQPNSIGVKPEPQQEHQTAIPEGYQRHPEDDGERLAREIGEAFVAKFKGAKLSEIVLAATSIALVLIGVSQAVVAWQNYHETSPLVGYAREATSAAGRNASAAEKFATNAELIKGGIDNAVGKLDAQAKATQQAANAATKSANTARDALVAQRPWLSIVPSSWSPISYEQGISDVSFSFAISNHGSITAIRYRFTAKLFPSDVFPQSEPDRWCQEQTKVSDVNVGNIPDEYVIFPGDTDIRGYRFHDWLKQDQVEVDGFLHPVIVGCVVYQSPNEVGRWKYLVNSYLISYISPDHPGIEMGIPWGKTIPSSELHLGPDWMHPSHYQ